MSEMGLAKAIAQLRAEVAQAIDQGRREALKFELSPIEVELQVQLTQEADAKAEVKWVVVSIGAGVKSESVQTHKIKFTLTPQGTDGPVLVGAPAGSEPK
jgi:Trypsin-co-occurring domain 2